VSFPCDWQRITEIAGVVVSFDPKPIPVTISLPNILGFDMWFLCYPVGLMSSGSVHACDCRGTGMALVHTPTTGRTVGVPIKR
jgi:hypothetical protein